MVLLDRHKPPKADLVVDAVCEAAPWAREKIRWVEAPIERGRDHLDPETSVVAVHACGVRTDRAIDLTFAVNGHLAAIPCCYNQTAKQAPRALRDALGAQLLPEMISMYDDPTLTEHEGQSLVGHYTHDDEGLETRRAELVEQGVIRGYLTTRAGVAKRHRSNGHARNETFERPMSRMGVTVIEATAAMGSGYRSRERK